MSAIHLGIYLMILQVLLTDATPIINDRNMPHCVKCSIMVKNKRNLINRQMKKDLFVSRGWGASGMPFNVLYMKSPHTAQFRSEIMDRPVALAQMQENPKHTPHVRKHTKNNKKGNVENGAAVPQLFVSYGWGPLGRK